MERNQLCSLENKKEVFIGARVDKYDAGKTTATAGASHVIISSKYFYLSFISRCTSMSISGIGIIFISLVGTATKRTQSSCRYPASQLFLLSICAQTRA